MEDIEEDSGEGLMRDEVQKWGEANLVERKECDTGRK